MMKSSGRRVAQILALALFVPAVGACVTKPVVQPASGAPTVAPALTVERFLRAAAAEDLDTMARLFGTADGPVIERDKREDVERRMSLLARGLKHQDFRLITEGEIPGRSGTAVRVRGIVTQDGEEKPVPFVVVRSDGGWLIEQIGLEALTTQS